MGGHMGQLLRELRRRLRPFYGRRSPAPIVTLVLAPAVGMSAAVVNLVIGLMFQAPPHVAQPDRVIEVGGITTFEDAAALAASARTFDLAASSTGALDFGSAAGVTAVQVQCATPNYLAVLGVRPLAGRLFGGKDGGAAPDVAVLGYGFWQRQFGGQRDVLGSRITLRRRAYTVIGVAPQDFTGLESTAIDAWIPLVPGGETCSPFGASGSSPTVIGRIRNGFSLKQAASEVLAFQSSTPQYVDHQRVGRLRDSARGVVGRDGHVLAWLGGGALVVLLVACSNAAALFSIHAIRRRREIAIRLCLGASRVRIVGLLVAESLSAAALCTVTAWLAAVVTGSALARFFSSHLWQQPFDLRLWGLVAAVALVGCVLSGALPALHASRRPFATVLKGDALATDRHGRLRSLVLVAQVAVGFALLVGAGLFWRSVANLRDAAGYDMDHVLAVTLDARHSVYEEDKDIQPWRDGLYRQLQHNAAVTRVTLASNAPLAGAGIRTFAMVRNDRRRTELAAVNAVSAEYFETLGVPIGKGRPLASIDTFGSPPVAVVSEALALRIWHTTDVVGQCAFLAQRTECAQVVGVARSMRSRMITADTPEIFIPVTQGSLYRLPWTGRTLLVKADNPATAIAATKVAARFAAPGLAIDIESLAAAADPWTRSWRLGATVFGLVGVLTFLLAVIGLHCSLSLLVRQRTPELGVRVALGASPLRVFRMALREGLMVLAVGWAVGTGLAFVLERLVRSMLYGVVAIDLATFVVASAGLLLVGIVACVAPSVRAARLDPLVALRME
jgi:predicted permease